MNAVPDKRPWVMTMGWHDLLFAHWPVPADAVRALLPRTTPALELDTFEGRAWIGVVPFGMSHIRIRGLPPIPGTHAFLELNVRTYVVVNGRPGVWFFSLDAASKLAVRAARVSFHLPYFDAAMSCAEREGWTCYESRRTHRNGGTADLDARYRPVGDVFRSAAGSLEHWLTDRDCLFAADSRGRLRRGDIHHQPWPLQSADADFTRMDMTGWLGLELPRTAPHLLFARQLDVRAWLPVPAS